MKGLHGWYLLDGIRRLFHVEIIGIEGRRIDGTWIPASDCYEDDLFSLGECSEIPIVLQTGAKSHMIVTGKFTILRFEKARRVTRWLGFKNYTTFAVAKFQRLLFGQLEHEIDCDPEDDILACCERFEAEFGLRVGLGEIP